MAFTIEQGLNVDGNDAYWTSQVVPVAGAFAAAEVTIGGASPFRTQGFLVKNMTANTVEYSIDGVNKHGELAGSEIHGYDFRRISKIYFRSTLGSTVQITAW